MIGEQASHWRRREECLTVAREVGVIQEEIVQVIGDADKGELRAARLSRSTQAQYRRVVVS